MDALELNNQIAQLIVDFIAYIPTIGDSTQAMKDLTRISFQS